MRSPDGSPLLNSVVAHSFLECSHQRCSHVCKQDLACSSLESTKLPWSSCRWLPALRQKATLQRAHSLQCDLTEVLLPAETTCSVCYMLPPCMVAWAREKR
jgi:hypothetical protein